jgi:DNA modification methylase
MYLTEDNIGIVEEELVLQAYSKPKKDFRNELFDRYKDKLRINSELDRSLISFQANKKEPLYRWFKYKEGFSTAFVEQILHKYGKSNKEQVVLDPFSGIGTTVTTAIANGFDAIGIELLQPGILATEARIISQTIDHEAFKKSIESLSNLDFYNSKIPQKYFFNHLTITQGAFPEETECAIANINQFLSTPGIENSIKILIRFAVNSILEEVSFTRKDGQYLRWDYRSNRQLKSSFNKGKIHPFKERLLSKLKEIQDDLRCKTELKNQYQLMKGSCLFELSKIDSNSIDLVVTSPPYCNRYDYTRTYALELAYNGVDDHQIKDLRQTLLSATVENKSKFKTLLGHYDSIGQHSTFFDLVDNFRNFGALSETLGSLQFHRNELNNKNIPDMVANYFFEMNFVIYELSRVLKPGGKIVMVNDNVRYNGDEIQVDLLLSELASKVGLKTDVIWVLERGKGNSSQQMGVHGRQELRKCVYVWSKTN